MGMIEAVFEIDTSTAGLLLTKLQQWQVSIFAAEQSR